MKIAIISDIHANLYALLKVLEDIDTEDVNNIICLGDLVGYGPHPNEVIALIRRKNIISLKGNYDAAVVANEYNFIRNDNVNSFSLPWTVEELRNSNKYFLDNLPSSLTLDVCGKKVKFVHGSPRRINEYLTEDNPEVETILGELEEDILVCAHTHLPYGKQIKNKIIINDGSVGKPKNGTPHATYAILDIHNDANPKVKFKTVEYEVSKIVKDMEMKKFPTMLISSYKTGRA